MRVGSLFSGIGGFDLAARWRGWHTSWVSEIDPVACRVLATQFPDAPNLGDITKIDFTTVEPVDVLVGGFPCTDISNAGKQEGITGPQSRLWFDYARAIRDVRPRYVVVENVAALVHRGLGTVLGSLAEIGFDAEWGCFSASDVGAAHRRDRIWILAYPHRQPQPRLLAAGSPQGGSQTAPTGAVDPLDPHRGAGASPRRGTPPLPRLALGRVAHGLPNHLARLRALGNAIVPQCASILYDRIDELERQQ